MRTSAFEKTKALNEKLFLRFQIIGKLLTFFTNIQMLNIQTVYG